jgi:23S rRNA (cytosine1962-C5)-methyltransferase
MVDALVPGLPTATVVLKRQRARPFFGRHPWVLDSAVAAVEGTPGAGDVVDLATHDGRFVARGLWNPHSRIRVRLYAFDAATKLDDAFWRARIGAAVALRKDLGLDDRAGAARLVNSEGDDLSGLIVDRYGDYLAVQVTALAMATRLEVFCDALEAAVAPRGILLRGAERGLAKLEGLALPDRLIRGAAPTGPIFVHEHGLRFGVDLAEGQTAAARGRGDLVDIVFRGVFQPPGVDHHVFKTDRCLHDGRRLGGRRGLGRRQKGRGQKGIQHGRVPG